MTTHTINGLTIELLTETPAATHEYLLKSLIVAIQLVATHQEATADDRESAIGLSRLLLALTPDENRLARMA